VLPQRVQERPNDHTENTKRAVDTLKPNGSGFTVWVPEHLAFQMPRGRQFEYTPEKKGRARLGRTGSLKITQLA
jgi:hypothetical protein